VFSIIIRAVTPGPPQIAYAGLVLGQHSTNRTFITTMDSLADAAGLLRPLAQQLGLDCSVLFSNTRDLAESDSNVLEIFSSAFGRSLILKEQRIGEKGTQVRCCCT
jgi:hypothetical protein